MLSPWLRISLWILVPMLLSAGLAFYIRYYVEPEDILRAMRLFIQWRGQWRGTLWIPVVFLPVVFLVVALVWIGLAMRAANRRGGNSEKLRREEQAAPGEGGGEYDWGRGS